jgi:hypothetical protein
MPSRATTKTRPAASLRFQALNPLIRSNLDRGTTTDGLASLARAASVTNRRHWCRRTWKPGMPQQHLLLGWRGVEREPERDVPHGERSVPGGCDTWDWVRIAITLHAMVLLAPTTALC